MRLALLAAVSLALVAAGCPAKHDVIFELRTSLGADIPPPSAVTITARVTRSDGPDDATTVNRAWPAGEMEYTVQLALGETASGIDATVTLLSSNGFPLARADVTEAFAGPGRYFVTLTINDVLPPGSDAGAADAGGADAGGADAGGADAGSADAGGADAGDGG